MNAIINDATRQKTLIVIDFGNKDLTNLHYSPNSQDGRMVKSFTPVQSAYSVGGAAMGHCNTAISWRVSVIPEEDRIVHQAVQVNDNLGMLQQMMAQANLGANANPNLGANANPNLGANAIPNLGANANPNLGGQQKQQAWPPQANNAQQQAQHQWAPQANNAPPQANNAPQQNWPQPQANNAPQQNWPQQQAWPHQPQQNAAHNQNPFAFAGANSNAAPPNNKNGQI
jgi:hypothetical protein